jgi:predicted N-formylglutamate amidohydrolase
MACAAPWSSMREQGSCSARGREALNSELLGCAEASGGASSLSATPRNHETIERGSAPSLHSLPRDLMPSAPPMSGLLHLLADDEPPPFRVIEGLPDSPYVLAADHANRAIPRALGTLGLSQAELDTHIAWDIGIAGVSEHLATRLGGFLITQTYSRLVIDCNRPLGAHSSIVQQSEHTVVPGNRSVSAPEAEARAREIFRPYHLRIEAELDRRERVSQHTVFVAMHSFTPCFKGIHRPWHVGVLYHRDARLAGPLLGLLRREGLEVGDNEPYQVTDHSDYAVPHYGEQRGNLHVELELRQDLISTAAQQASWAELLARVLRQALSDLPELAGAPHALPRSSQ